ncbi:uncharacterized protein LY89DRAFT_718847 [Mollisia scopiformis]|uniref:Uncharacterized protein n=1 Tax=Mollisia scopiformis TaxID=149040 RepID=A0A194XBQ1_MOLSC|nr:uncharacterized protein LY89DRAFT_718847 [Mollisia scopiformis]KUJ17192.1 hypothetical protein LY89DRAFT_718847 [Mollisia scopiformis]
MKYFGSAVLALQLFHETATSKPITPRQLPTRSECPSESSYPTAFSLQAIEVATNSTMVLAPVDNISFDEPGTWYLGGGTDFTFNLTDYNLAIGNAPCGFQGYETSSGTLGVPKCSVQPGGRGQLNPYFSIGYSDTLGISILQLAHPNVTGAGSACGEFATSDWGPYGEVYMNITTCGSFPAGYDPIIVQIIPVNGTQS